MILTVNPNAAVDLVMFIDEFRPGSSMRPKRVVLSVGGKALDSAVVLKSLGAPVQALSFVAGENGKVLARLLEERNIPAHLMWVSGDTRHTYVIVETNFNRHSQISTSGYSITEPERAAFIEQAKRYAPRAAWAVLAGSLPGGAGDSFYRQLIDGLQEQGVKTLLDAAGPPAVEALSARPAIVKMNQAEFCGTFKVQVSSMTECEQACREVMDRYQINSFVLTCGKQGMLAMTAEETILATAPIMKEVNASGSGDAASAALAYRFSLGDTWEQALRWAAATAAAVVLTEGTAECCMDDIEDILPATEVRPFVEVA